MAYQPTKGRGVFVQPTGTPDFTGFRQAASQYQQISEIASSVGTDIRRRKYNEAIRQAEIDGETNGMTYDKDGNLVPLVNFDYSKSNDLFSEGDRKAVLDTYRKAAIGSYVSASIVDINNSAEQAFLNNPNNPDEIMGAKEGYLQGLNELDPEIYNKLAPKVESAFGSAHNKAFANQQSDAEKQSRAYFKQNYKQNVDEISAIYAAGKENVEGSQVRIKELVEENNTILEHLETFNESPENINDLKVFSENQIALRYGASFVKKAYAEKESYADGLLAIEEIYKQFDGLPESNVDAESLRSSLVQELNYMNDIKKAKETEINDYQTNIYQNALRKITLNPLGFSPSAELLNEKSPLNQLSGGQLVSLMAQSEAQREKRINVLYDADNDILSNWENVIGTEQEAGLFKNFSNVHQLYKEGYLDDDKFFKSKEHIENYIQHRFVQPNIDQSAAYIQTELSGASSFTVPPSEMRDLIPSFQKSGVVGPDGKWKNIAAISSDIDAYAVRYNKQLKESLDGQKAFDRARAGLRLSSTELEDLYKFTPNYKAVIYNDEKDTTVVVEPNFLTDDETLFEASVDAADRFASETNGHLLPEAKRVFDSAKTNVDLTEKARRIMGQVVTGLASEMKKPNHVALNHFFDVNQFSEADRAFFLSVNKVGPKLAVEAYRGKRDIDVNKGLTNVIANRANGELLETAVDKHFDDTFTKAVTGHNFWALFNPKISKMRQTQLDEFKRSTGMSASQLAEATFRDPIMRETMKNLYLERLAQMDGEGNPEEIMRSVLQSVGTRFGFEEDLQTGQIYLVDRPIINYAQATVPGIRLNDGTLVPNVEITNRMIAEDAVRRYLDINTGFRDPEFDRAVSDVLNDQNFYRSNISFHANDSFGGEQTYRVYVTDHYGNPQMIHSNYRYNFNTSVQNKYYQQTMNDLETSRIKQWWTAWGLMDKSVLQSTFENYQETGSDNSLLPLVRELDRIRILTSPGASPAFQEGLGKPFSPEEIQDILRVYNTVITGGRM